MRFNSLIFILFLGAVVTTLWLLPAKWRKIWLLAASYTFYGSWHWPYLLLMVGSIAIAFVGARWIDGVPEQPARVRRERLVLGALVLELFLFKYLDWSIGLFNGAVGWLGIEPVPLMQWILPLGISFYLFQAMSYVIDVTRKKEKVWSFWDVQFFICFFPQLVAGPIMRAKELLPQLGKDWKLEPHHIRDGIQMVATGLFMKIVLADLIAVELDKAYQRPVEALGSIDILVMGLGFGLQVYFDFASYSRIAIGAGSLCGVRIVKNFNFPFSATNPVEFWNRWHMSLSHWIRDYLFYPLMGKDFSLKSMIRATMISMSLCGLWHGAGGKFIALGVYHGLLISGFQAILARRARLAKLHKEKKVQSPASKRVWGMAAIALMAVLLVPGWIFFRSKGLEHSAELFARMLTPWAHARRALPGTLYAQVALLYALVWLAPAAKRWLEALEAKVAERELPRLAYTSGLGFASGLAMIAAAVYLKGNSAFIYFQF